ncbi:Endonuclease/exonuclease/phosphatase [Cinara cedri]|uniref:Endonuclease/exonuclease/phosphatase n=1 Tax=Cinara cedri TaxID=506608 RepID=A0A5E4N7D9_9HEMI|nr:Endonuclease/exonuclease/phosphatase [Cinara cedri]
MCTRKLINHIPITFAVTFCPPKHKITPLQYENFFNDLGHYFIVGGDLNAKNQPRGCHTSNPKRLTLIQIVNRKNYSILAPPDPTYWPTSKNKRPDILDIFIVNIPTNIQNVINNCLELCSDHTSVLSLDAQPPLRPRKACLTDGTTDWNKFREIIEQNINLKTRLKCPNELENAVQHFTNIIQTAAWSSTIRKP